MNPLIQFKRISLPLLIVTVLVCFALLPEAHGVTPAPDGGYANGNTAFGWQALFFNRNGARNNAFGTDALSTNTSGNDNIAIGSRCTREQRRWQRQYGRWSGSPFLKLRRQRQHRRWFWSA